MEIKTEIRLRLLNYTTTSNEVIFMKFPSALYLL